MFDFSTASGIAITLGYCAFCLLLFRIGSGLSNPYILARQNKVRFNTGAWFFLSVIGLVDYSLTASTYGFTNFTLAAGLFIFVAQGYAYGIFRYCRINERKDEEAHGKLLSAEQLDYFESARQALVVEVVKTALLYGRSAERDLETEIMLVYQLSRVTGYIGNKKALRTKSAVDYLNSYIGRLNEIRDRIGARKIPAETGNFLRGRPVVAERFKPPVF